jgi:hypothetical protein
MAVITNPLDANGNVEVNLPTTLNHTGYAVLAGENHNGELGVATPLRRTARITPDGRLRVGIDSPYWQDTFNHAVADTSAYQMVTATATLAMTAGYMVFNAGNSVALNAVARVQTYRTFNLNAAASLEVMFRARFAINLQANNVGEMGLGYAATTATPTAGVYYKITSAGAIEGCVNFNGTEVTTPLTGFTMVANENNYYRIVIDQDRAEFYINGVLYGFIAIANTAAAVTFPRALPLLMRLYNSAATTAAQRLEISDVAVLGRDLNQVRDWETAQVGMEQGSYLNPRGVAAGQTANYVNSTAPVNATLSNTAAGYTTLGGQFGFAAVAGAATDYALFAYQVPAPAAAGGNKNLVIRGIRIEALNTGAAVATTATVLQWSLGVGSTAVSLATADSATAGTRAPRRVPLGFQSFPVGAAIGAIATPVNLNLDAPVYVAAGTFVHVILKMPIGTATASQVIQGMVTINGYWE